MRLRVYLEGMSLREHRAWRERETEGKRGRGGERERGVNKKTKQRETKLEKAQNKTQNSQFR
jgi:hypothetical protein